MIAADQFFENKRILITGACGTVGRRILSVLLQDEYFPGEIIGIDNNESGLFSLQQRYIEEDRCRFFLADVRDREKLSAPVRKNGDVMRASRRRADKARKISNIGNIAFFRNAV
ncbi:MAG: polysaccharide biosynthesis protein, partial [Desulfobacteraceae bacterium]|nr:polysaccharide biosynthesis protein [Desulfobacteraceae bacterium]